MKLLIISLLLIICSGLIISTINFDEIYDKKYDGLRFEGTYTHPEALDKAQDYDEYGDWVCVNVRNMDYERAINVIKHEVYHEIWAECGESNNLTYCIEQYSKEINKNETI